MRLGDVVSLKRVNVYNNKKKIEEVKPKCATNKSKEEFSKRFSGTRRTSTPRKEKCTTTPVRRKLLEEKIVKKQTISQ